MCQTRPGRKAGRGQEISAGCSGHGIGGADGLSASFLHRTDLPFYGGTYFPPEGEYGRPGFKAILSSISALYRDRKDDINGQGAKLLEVLKPAPGSQWAAEEGEAAEGTKVVLSQYEEKYGGFGKPLNFPCPERSSFSLTGSS